MKRRLSRLAALRASGALIVSAVLVIAAVSAFAREVPGGSRSRFLDAQTAAMEQARHDAAVTAAREQAFRASPAGRRARARSRRAYRRQSAAGAFATTRHVFPALVEGKALRWPPLAHGEKLKGYLGLHSAVVREPGGKRGIVQSTAPLVGTTPAGDAAPVNLALTAVRGGFAAKSSPIRVRLPRRAGDALAFPDQALGVSLEGADPVSPRVSSSKAFYANVLRDTDMVLEPTTSGGEASFVLRSPDSPTDPALRFDLRRGQSLRLTGDEPQSATAEVVAGKRHVATIPPAAAVDAQGRPVPVAYSVSGDRLVLDVRRGNDVAYPIVVDPSYGIYDRYGQNICPSTNPNCPANVWKGWTRAASSTMAPCNAPGTAVFLFCQGSNGGYSTGGAIYAYALPNTNYTNGWVGEWYKVARTDTFIYRYDAFNLSHVVDNSQVFEGIACYPNCGANFWEKGSWRDKYNNVWGPATGTIAYSASGAAELGDSRFFCVDNGTRSPEWTSNAGTGGGPIACPPTTAAHENNGVIFGIQMLGATGATKPHVALGNGATFYSDNYPPTLSVKSHTVAPPGSTWVDSYSDTVVMHADERGTGMGNITLAGPGVPSSPTSRSPSGCDFTDPSTVDAKYVEKQDNWETCPAGGWDAPAIAYTAPEGVNSYVSTATDVVGNHDGAQDKTWTAKVDHTPPSASASGALNARDSWISDPSPSLTINARDDGPNGVPTSGVASDKIQFDQATNGPSDTKTNKKSDGTTDCDATSGCAQTLGPHTMSPALSDGMHTVDVTTKDAIGGTGHQLAQSWQVGLDRAKPVINGISGTAGTNNGWVSERQQSVHVSATDVSSGIRKVELYVDGASTPADSAIITCNPNCPTTFDDDLYWNPGTTETSHTLEARVTDAADASSSPPNKQSSTWTVKVDSTLPQYTSKTGNMSSSAWITTTPSITAAISDPRSGVKSSTLQLTPNGPSDTKTNNCDAGSGCPTSMTHPWSPTVSDGRYTLSGSTADAVQHSASFSNAVNIDRATPAVGTPSGTLYDARNHWVVAGGSRSVTVTATDATSGVRKLELLVDVPGARDTKTATCSPNCPTSFTGTLNWDSTGWQDGAHTIWVRATDDAGLTKDTAVWTVYTDGNAPLWGADSGSLAAVGWQSNPTPTLTVNPTDTGGSGVAKSTIQFDPPNGPTFTKFGQKADGTPCDDTPGCPTSMTHSVTPTLSDGSHSALITATDAVGQTRSRTRSTMLVDRVPPALSTPTGTMYVPGGWFGDGQKSVHVTSTDATSATTRIELWVDGVVTSSVACNTGCGTAPFSADFSWTPPAGAANGNHSFAIKSYDSAGNVATQAWTTGLDRLQPDVPAVSGGGWNGEFADGTLRRGRHDISVSAHDSHSGVKRIEGFVDNADDPNDTPGSIGQLDTTCQTSGCPQDASASMSWDDSTGPRSTWSHVHVLIRITDQVGNVRTVEKTLGRDGTNPTAVVTGTLKQPDQILSGRPYTLTVAALDGSANAPSSGVARIELQLDSELRDSCDQTVSGDFTPLTCNFTFDPQSRDEGQRAVKVTVRDRAGNVYTEQWSVIFDHTDPTLGAPTHTGLPSGWVDSATPTVKLDANDGESGVKKIDLYTPSPTTQGATDDTTTWDFGCTGTVTNPCAHSASHTFAYGDTLPEGNNRVHAHAEDAALPAHVSNPDQEWDVKIDRTPPDVQQTGSLTTLGTAPIVAGAYDLQIDATDGSRDARRNERSGVKSIEVLVKKESPDPPDADFHRVYYDEQGCDPGSCPMSRNWVFRREAYKEGTYTLRVKVTDQIGHVRIPDDRTIRVSKDVLEPRHAMGLEDFWQFQSIQTGAGTAAHVNLATGNVVWHSEPVVNPGRGLSTVGNVTYNSQQLTKDAALDYNQVGEGFSLGVAGLTRVNEPLDVSLADINGPIFLTDVDGTRHTFQPSGDAHHWIHPAGFDIYLRRFSPDLMPDTPGGVLDPLRAWAATRPDGVTYYFDTAGYPTFIQDRNGNQIRFDYQYLSVVIPNQPCAIVAPVAGTPLASDVCRRRLVRVVDPAGVDADPDPYHSGEAGENIAVRDERSVHLCYYPDVVEQLTGEPGTGPIKRLKDHGGRVTSFSYDDDRYLTSMTEAQQPTGDEADEGDCANTGAGGEQPAERTFRFDYEQKDPQADPLSLVAKRYMTSETDPRDHTTHFEYQSRDDALEDQVNTDVQSLTAFQRRRVLSIRDRESNVTQFGYSEDNPIDGPPTFHASVTDPRGRSSAYTMDKLARPIDSMDPDGTPEHPRMVETQITWDDQHFADNKVEKLVEAANVPEQTRTMTMLYDQTGQLTDRYLQNDPSNHHTHLDYAYSRGNQTAPNGWDDNTVFVGDLTDLRSPRAYSDEQCATCTTHLDRDENGNVRFMTDGEGDVSETHYEPVHHQIDYEIDPFQHKTTYSDWDASGLPRTKVDPRGNAGDPGSSHTWKYLYDPTGNVVGMTDPRGVDSGSTPDAPNSPYTTTLSYDQLDRLRVEHVPKDSVHGKYITRRTDYDVNDNTSSKTDGNGKVSTFTYTPMDRLEDASSPPARHEDDDGAAEPETTQYTYDPDGDLLSVDRPNGTRTSVDGDYSMRFVYDDANRRVGQVQRSHRPGADDPEQDLLTTYRYDARGNMTSIGDPRDNAAFAGSPGSYDEDVRNWDGPLRFRYAYDEADQRRDSYEDPSGLNLHTHTTYDANGNVTAQTNARGKTTSYVYDTADRLRDTIDPAGDKTHRDLNPDGSLRTLVKPNGTASSDPDDYRVGYEYDANGTITKITLPRAPSQYGQPLTLRYTRNAVEDPVAITDPRGSYAAADPHDNPYTFENTFYDTGDVMTTERPSWWRYAGGMTSDRAGNDVVEQGVPGVPGMGGGSGGSGAASGGGGMSATGGADSSDHTSPDGQDKGRASSPDKTPPGSLGSVQPQPLPDVVPDAGATSFDYDDEMRLTAVTDAAGRTTQIGRDALGRVKDTTRPFDGANEIVTSQAYDWDGNLRRSTNGRGFSTFYDYDQFDRRTQDDAPDSSDSARAITSTDYDGNGNVVKVVTPRGTASRNEYDAVDRMVLTANALGNTTTYRYDDAGNRVAERRPLGNADGCHLDGRTPACTPIGPDRTDCPNPDDDNPDPVCFETRMEYDDANRLVKRIDGLGHHTDFTLDDDGNVTVTDAPGSRGSVGGDIQRQVTRQTYDGRDLRWATTTGTGDAERTRVSEYDGAGNVRREVNPAGVGADGLPEHPDADPAKQITDPSAAGDQSDVSVKEASHDATVHEYSPDNVETARHLAWGTRSDEDGDRYRIDYDLTSDGLGHVRRITTPYKWAAGETGATADLYSYYDTGWTRSAQDSGGDTVDYAYDEAGDQTVWRVGPEGSPTREVTRHFWPSGTLQKRVALADGRRQRYEYAYNPNRDLERVDFSRHDDDTVDRTTTVDYDDADRQLHIGNTDHNGGTDRYFERDTVFRYDADGNVARRFTDGQGDAADDSYSGGPKAYFDHDVLDRDKQARIDRPGAETHIFRTDYYPSGARSELRKLNQGSGGETPRVTDDFFYRDDGHVVLKLRTRGDGGGTPDETHYAYDDANADRTHDERGSYTFNARSQLTHWDPSDTEKDKHPGPVDYEVDGNGNATKKVEHSSGDAATPTTTTTTSEYPQGRLTDSHTTVSGAGLSGCLSRDDHYSYGEFGRLERIHGTKCGVDDQKDTQYDYDGFDRLIRAVVPDQKTQTYSYDGLDRRDQKCRDNGLDKPADARDELTCPSGHLTTYSYVGTSKKLASEHDDDGGSDDQFRSYDFDSKGTPLGVQRDKQSASQSSRYLSYDTDVQGSITGLEGDGGDIGSGDHYYYDPFGSLRSNTDPTTPPDPNDPNSQGPPDPNADHEADAQSGYSQEAQDNPLRFEGFYYDSGVKLYDMQARTYRPDIGRFLTPDRFEASDGEFDMQSDPLTQNRYAWAGANPISNIEFDGHEPASSFTNPCDMTYGSSYSCGRAPKKVQIKAAQDRRRFNYAVSNNYPEGRASSPAQDKQNAKKAADRGNAKNPYLHPKDDGGGITGTLNDVKNFVGDRASEAADTIGDAGKSALNAGKQAAHDVGEFGKQFGERAAADIGAWASSGWERTKCKLMLPGCNDAVRAQMMVDPSGGGEFVQGVQQQWHDMTHGKPGGVAFEWFSVGLTVVAPERAGLGAGARATSVAGRGIADDAVVVRGGTKPLPPAGEKFSGAAGRDLNEAASGVPHGTIRSTTAGEIRAGGGTVEHAPEMTRGGLLNELHVNICLGEGSCPFGDPMPNPVPSADRVH